MAVKERSTNRWSCWETWSTAADEYCRLVADESRDSHYLRSQGLLPTLVEMIGDCSDQRLLDIGCGDGALLLSLHPREGYACDIVDQPSFRADWQFTVQDARYLTYESDFFDVVVSSLSLMWFEELDEAVRQMCRVARPGGRAVTALVHPYYYRTGEPDADGNFVLRKDLSKPFRVEGLRIGGVAGPFTYYYRPFSDYLNAFAQTGFRICRVSDWFLDTEEYMKHTEGRIDAPVPRTGKVPMYSFLECIKE